MKSEVEVNYLFVSYVQQSIKNSASACLKKKQKYSHTYFPTDSLEDIMRSSISESYLSLDFISAKFSRFIISDSEIKSRDK